MIKIFKFIIYIFFILNTFFLKNKNLEANDLLNQLNANNDWGLWLDFSGNFDLLPKGVFALPRIGFRWGADMKKLYYEIYEIVLQQKILVFKHPCYTVQTFSLGPGYAAVHRLRKNTQGIHQWVWDNRMIAEGNLSSAIGKWQVEQRMRGEYRSYSKPYFENYGLYRHRLVVHSPWTYFCGNIKPFVFNEWFFRKNNYNSNNSVGLVGGWYENRFRVGAEFVMKKNVTNSFYFQWKINRERPGSSPPWRQNYDIGITLSAQN